MKVVVAHNFYKQPGGEDQVFAAETNLLESRGHMVLRLTVHNDEVDAMPKWRLAAGTIWNPDSYRAVRQKLSEHRPDVLHFHNIMPLFSPSVYYAARAEGVPVIQTLHNPRLMCPSATLYRGGALCTECLDKRFAWPGVMHKCYHDSAVQTAVIASMAGVHRLTGTWRRIVTQYIVFTEFYRQLFERAGLPPERIAVKPHFVPRDHGVAERDDGYALFVGRLDPEKGIRTLLAGWRLLEARGVSVPLKVRGEGQLLDEVRASGIRSLELVPRLAPDGLAALMKGAKFLVWPCCGYYETFGLVVIEAFAAGVPVICSDIGVATCLVDHGRTGLRYRPDDSEHLATTIQHYLQHSTDKQNAMRRAARLEYEAKYTAARNYEMLVGIYQRAIETAAVASRT